MVWKQRKTRQFLVCGCGCSQGSSRLMTEELCGSKWTSVFDSFEDYIYGSRRLFSSGDLALLLLLLQQERRQRELYGESLRRDLIGDIL